MPLSGIGIKFCPMVKSWDIKILWSAEPQVSIFTTIKMTPKHTETLYPFQISS